MSSAANNVVLRYHTYWQDFEKYKRAQVPTFSDHCYRERHVIWP